ncbi:MAG: low molecular weight protein-tyrosine-phosphatase [Paracoccaceae bacterium]
MEESSVMRVLFVCLGNICRSPTAQAVLRTRAPHWHIDSAGTAGWHIGKPPYNQMQLAANAKGYAMDDLRARQLSVEDFRAFDLILGMDAENLSDLKSFEPADGTARIACFTDYVADADHVPDPYYTRDFDGVLGLIERCADAMIAAETPR